MDALGVAQAIAGVALLAFVPGYVWSRALLPSLDRIERFVTAVGLSIALMVLALYLGSAVASINVSATHAVWWSLALTLAGAAVWASRRRHGVARRPA